MNFSKITIVVLILTYTAAYSQRGQMAKITAQVVYDENRTEEVLLEVPTDTLEVSGLAMSMISYDATGKKHRLYPQRVKEVKFTYKGKDIRMVSVKHASRIKRENQSFLELVKDGPMKLYAYYEDQRDAPPALPGPPVPGEAIPPGRTSDLFWNKGMELVWVMRKRGHGTAVYPKKLGFEKQMEKFFEDCPIVLDSIKTRNLKRKDMDRMVTIYNENCGK